MDSKDKRSLAEVFQQAWAQALARAIGAEEELGRTLARLQESAGLSQEEARRAMQHLSERLVTQRQELERRAEASVRAAVGALRVPRREQVAELSTRLDALEARVEALRR